jgi:general secretion pathway protein J
VRIAESTDRQGIALVRSRAPFAPFGLGDVSANQLNFTDPVVLLRAPFRVSFSYSSGDGSWSDAGRNGPQLPSVVRFLVRDQTTGRTLAVSTATMVHVEVPADCASGGGQACGSQSPSNDPTAPGGGANAPNVPNTAQRG